MSVPSPSILPSLFILLSSLLLSSALLSFSREIGGQGKAIRFILSAGFPPKDILDPTITVSEAGFAGAAITMKLA